MKSSPLAVLHRVIRWGILLATVVGSLLLVVRCDAARRACLLVAALATAYVAATLLDPYLYFRVRYVDKVIPVLFLALATPSVRLLCETALRGRLPPRRVAMWGNVMTVGVTAVVLVLVGGRGPRPFSGHLVVEPEARDAIACLRQADTDALVAGWPAGLMDLVPCVASRRVLVNHKIHQAFHVRYTLEMRSRADAVFQAYFATDARPLRRLANEFGVTHLLIDRRHFEERVPSYFEPFNGDIRRLHASIRRGPLTPIVLNMPPEYVLTSNERYVLYDLRRLAEDSAADGGPVAHEAGSKPP